MSSSSDEPACIVQTLSHRWTDPDKEETIPIYEQDIEDGELLDKTTASSLDYSSQDDEPLGMFVVWPYILPPIIWELENDTCEDIDT